MTLLRRRAGIAERMDAADIDPRALEGALRHVARVNRWLGGRRALLRHLDWALPDGPARLLDVGTGSADLPLAVLDARGDRAPGLHVTALDRHRRTLAIARGAVARAGRQDDVRLVAGDALALPFPEGAFDVALLSMTLHHMDGPHLTACLRELARVARGGRILVGELERCIPGYVGARLMAATVWAANPVTRHDGPVSILRAFTPDELLRLAREAGLRRAVVRRHPLFRLVLRAEAGRPG